MASCVLLAGTPAAADERVTRFQHSGRPQLEGAPDLVREQYSEAPTGFDNRSNGFTRQGPPFDSLSEAHVKPQRSQNHSPPPTLFIIGIKQFRQSTTVSVIQVFQPPLGRRSTPRT